MRSLKFRVWDTQEKKYLYPEKQVFIIVPTRPSFGVTIPYENIHNPDNIDEDCFDWADADLLTGRYKLEQYIGLKDKDGKEIYENDLMEYDACLYKVLWYKGGFTFKHIGKYGWTSQDVFAEGRVIGSIHENPESLGDEE